MAVHTHPVGSTSTRGPSPHSSLSSELQVGRGLFIISHQGQNFASCTFEFHPVSVFPVMRSPSSFCAIFQSSSVLTVPPSFGSSAHSCFLHCLLMKTLKWSVKSTSRCLWPDTSLFSATSCHLLTTLQFLYLSPFSPTALIIAHVAAYLMWYWNQICEIYCTTFA